MKAMVYGKYGSTDVLRLQEVEKPTPNDNELLIKVHATTVTVADVRMRGFDFPPVFWVPARIMFGVRKPKKSILGHEFAGIVKAVGAMVTKFKVGDKVFGTTSGLQVGAYADYICVPEEHRGCVIDTMPNNVTFEEAAALPIGGMTALTLLQKGNIDQAKSVLIYGASGSVGTYAVQLAKHYGAYVTAVCSYRNLQLVKELGADKAIDYTKEDFTEQEETYDLIFDAVGKINKTKVRHLLHENSHYVTVESLTTELPKNLRIIKNLAQDGIIKPLIDRTYSLIQLPEAHAYVETGRKRGNVVIIMDEATNKGIRQ